MLNSYYDILLESVLEKCGGFLNNNVEFKVKAAQDAVLQICNTRAAYLADGTHDRLTMIESYIESECNTLSNSFCNTDVKAHQDSDFQLSAPGLYLAGQPDRLATSLPGNKMAWNSSITPQKLSSAKIA